MIPGLEILPLRPFRDDRGWLMEIRRESLLPNRTVQTNVSFSRQGVIRGLHYHERGQDDLFVCLTGTARVVVLDRETDEVFTADIGDENPVAIYVPGHHAHGFEALTDLLFCYHVTREFDPADPDEHGIPWDDPQDQAPLEHAVPDPVQAGLAARPVTLPPRWHAKSTPRQDAGSLRADGTGTTEDAARRSFAAAQRVG